MRRSFFLITLAILYSSCQQYLDVVPDNIATIDNAFTMRSQAQKFLYTCYSYMPKHGNMDDDPSFVGGDELWMADSRTGYFDIARGRQGVVSPLGDRWGHYYRALRDCNIFLENIHKVPDLDDVERKRWQGEVLFLKAYYHYYLINMYGPIPLVQENLPVSSTEEQVMVTRESVDDCFNYVVKLLDEAALLLPDLINDPANELGRVTKPIALALKAKALVTAASPLFNGNTDQASLRNPDGKQLFNQQISIEKWEKAAKATEEAISLCHRLGMGIYTYNPDFQPFNLTQGTITQLNIRNSVTEKWNKEIVWANTQASTIVLQRLTTTWWDPQYRDGTLTKGELSPPLKIAEMYYSKNGVPITEDKTYNYASRYSLRTGDAVNRLLIKEGYTTAQINFDREPRFYAHMGFDGGVWYGQGKYDDSKPQDLFYLQAKFKQRNAYIGLFGSVTGYYVKKLIHFQNVIGESNTYSVNNYPWPVIRLADLYLLYAEALNEVSGPGEDVYFYINEVRTRAGLPHVQDAWTNFSTNPTKFQSQTGLRDIIQRERLIELAFEGHRFWDLRRWKKATSTISSPVLGWDTSQEDAAYYYRPSVIFEQKFTIKDYFWPITESYITVNRNLVQNTGW